MHILFVLIGSLLIPTGLLMVYMFPGSELLGIALIGTAGFLGVLGRMAQASAQHEEILAAWRGEVPERRSRQEIELLSQRG